MDHKKANGDVADSAQVCMITDPSKKVSELILARIGIVEVIMM